jgi:shikimate kinase
VASIVALIGFMGSGKTSVGRKAARLLGCHFVDLDDEIERLESTSIPEIFAREGESGFRDKELKTLRRLLAAASSERAAARQGTAVAGRREAGSELKQAACLVLALGGGTPTIPEARKILGESATVILLQVDPGEAWRRVQDGKRPLARNEEEFCLLLEARRAAYEAVADIVLDTTGRTPEEIAAEIAQAIRREGHSRKVEEK